MHRKCLSALIVIALVLSGALGASAAVNSQGDVNLDTQVNIKDATLIQKHLAKLVSIDDAQLLLADVDGVAGVNIKDATHLQKWIAGMADELYGDSGAQETPLIPDSPVELPVIPFV